MKTKIFITAVAMILCLPATADFVQITRGHEVSLGSIRLPQIDGGTIAYKPCRDCDYEVSRLASDVRWEINGRPLTLTQFRKQTESISNREKHAVTVTQHIESKRITEVSTNIRDSE